ncbi:non-canonical purine NTP pyrophosphatase [Parasphaerochaeta coccoides]|uniref:dITP/XTP pyrophosphatase n=1 Tax=Parasphaerochaeta coccoides (strain ATCC BAA-1237 / DSM 17374 / SPN1) TaxID=760011 RepID=F4GHC3_PARC1|nr:non-canonical purine NTP pyrophosphatase [Parasphaerochaeta coccoides]AEC02022.1 Nucleoside-triphosphatase rdgB [Parasphaerochaeta coccoides DSM 17374]
MYDEFGIVVAMKKILLASGNLHKKEEIQRMLPEYEIMTPTDVGVLWDCEENAPTFTGNALIKALALHKVTSTMGIPILADDSGLVIPALGGEPGVHSARYGSENAGRLLEAHEKNKYLLHNMEGYVGSQRKASFVCAIAVVFSSLCHFTVQEEVEGSILTEEHGSGGFGYDPIFFVDEAGMSMAALDSWQKDYFSHRGRALRAAQKILTSVYCNKESTIKRHADEQDTTAK